ncbi:BrxA/BrxB family bacilliredoxin [Caldibacillus lycopersici]|uniref:BrxA/BrxB family bacilliredoxin n=1 Tax=Perspicuibacillus lycopersici TaxID=1325689 RepID=A0AAE3IS63_9BACI|nr:BrxA/BrxB family bacilliredoxin [Perspicuibacillus lycopersici]MCU9613640.1 BrxA/BrxB family bacilliredoxin [Perspicuibacillus lycopersici]
MSNAYEEYMRQLVVPMRAELVENGFTELRTAEAVEKFMETADGTTFVVVNSVCGCAGGLARPAVTEALATTATRPDHLVTVFAGQDKEATEKMREYFKGLAPSSPSMAVLKGKEVVHFIPREDIEYHTVEEVVENIVTAFGKYCN